MGKKGRQRSGAPLPGNFIEWPQREPSARWGDGWLISYEPFLESGLGLEVAYLIIRSGTRCSIYSQLQVVCHAASLDIVKMSESFHRAIIHANIKSARIGIDLQSLIS